MERRVDDQGSKDDCSKEKVDSNGTTRAKKRPPAAERGGIS